MSEQHNQISAVAGALVTHQRHFGAMSTEDRQWVFQNTAAAIELFASAVKNRLATEIKKILKLISGGETILIDACDGTETLAQAKDTFKSGIDSDFKNWGTDKKGVATEETAVQVYEMAQNATFVQMFGSLGSDLDKLCFTQAQIKNFCKKHANWLRQNENTTLFLFKVDGQVFVAGVDADDVGLGVCVYRLERGGVWNAEYLLRVVVPQMIA